jgi:transcriptional regulator with XRE-family HTH domain
MKSAATIISYPEKVERFSVIAKELRQKAKLTLHELSIRSGLAVSTISKMENGQLSPSYETILRLADGLEVDVAELFSADSHTGIATARRSVTRHGQGVVHSSPQYSYEMMCPDLSHKAFIPLITTIKAHSIDKFQTLPKHEGEEFVYVVSGSVELHTEYYEPVALSVGDSCYLDSTMGHALISTSKNDAVVVWVTSAPKKPSPQSPRPAKRKSK